MVSICHSDSGTESPPAVLCDDQISLQEIEKALSANLFYYLSQYDRPLLELAYYFSLLLGNH